MVLHNKNVLATDNDWQDYAKDIGVPYVSLEGFTISPELFEILPIGYATKLNVIPYKKEDNTLYVITFTLDDLELEKKLAILTGHSISIMLSTEQAIRAALKHSEASVKLLEHVSKAFESDITIDNNTLPLEQIINVEDIDERDPSSIVPLINSIILAALQRRASDIHIESSERGVVIKYRIDGVLYPATERLDRKFHNPLVTRVKVMSELDIAEKRIPQDGRFKLRINHRSIDFRVSILPGSYGEDIVIRILDKEAISNKFTKLSISNLGLDEHTQKQLSKSIYEPYGLVLITGPTGSGKTTTLYSALTERNNGEEKIITIEDPVEYQLNGITQIPVNEKKKLTFAKGLRSILRHDPDIIMVGEIRDNETAKISIQSSLTGHLVFSTIHANNAFDVIGRLHNMDIDMYSIVSALNCVMAQRLLRNICPHCKVETTVSNEYLELSGMDPSQYADVSWFKGEGCHLCYHTGYLGRSAVAEFLNITPRIRDMLLNHASLGEIEAAAEQEGMVPFRQAAIRKALSGETSLKEVNRMVFTE